MKSKSKAKSKTKTKSKPKAYSYLRFSTPEQLKGDSLRRQTELSRDYAEKHRLDLDESLTFKDLGVSGYTGKNIEGALGAFIEAVDEGIIEKGSYLLVESLDRLSRQNPYTAFQLFSELLNKGINIATLQDNKLYSTNDMDFGNLMISLVSMQRAFEESDMKSKRLRASWESRRKNIGNKKLTSACPAWLEYDKETDTFKVIPEKAAVIKRMFELTLEGTGNFKIAQTLNEEKAPTLGRGKRHHSSYVSRVLHNESVIGRFQPKTLVINNDKRKLVPTGEPIEDYFPAIISREMFYKVQKIKAEGMVPFGKTSQNYSNLFSGYGFCGVCGSMMHFENKANGTRTYLVCSSARLKAKGCKRYSWRYPPVEQFILLNILELDFRKVLPELFKKRESKRERTESILAIREAELEENEIYMNNLLDLLQSRPNNEALLKRFDTLDNKGNELRADIEDLNAKLSDTETEPELLEGIPEALRVYIDMERNPETDREALKAVRGRLYQLLKSTVDRIEFYPNHDEPKSDPHRDPDSDFELHGEIHISFRDLPELTRVIRVSKNQTFAEGYKLSNGSAESSVFTEIPWKREIVGEVFGYDPYKKK
jgi:DNA invertase Pin-like site-specific DNA recombinase